MATDRQVLAFKRQRQGYRVNCGKEIEKSQGYFDSDDAIPVDKYQTCVNNLKYYHTELKTLNADILLSIEGDDEAAAEVEYSAAFDYKLQNQISALTAKLDAMQLNNDLMRAESVAMGGGESTSGANSINGSLHSHGGPKSPSVHLPKLQMAKFGGDHMKWAEFWDSYSTTIHENVDLADIDKFKYLKSFLFGDALRLVDGYRLTNANYTEVIESLCERFGNTQLAVHSHFDALLALPAVSSHDTHKLQSIYDDCEKHIRSLVALGLPEETFGQVFIPIILSKLPIFVKMELHRKNGSNPWELSKLREWLREEIRARDYSQRTFGGSGNGNKGDSHHNGHHNGHNIDNRNNYNNNRIKQQSKPPYRNSAVHQGTSSAMVSGDVSQKTGCAFCGGSHYADRCTKYPDVDSRKTCMNGRCFVCLSTRHSMKNCTSPRPCAHCGKNGHHRSLCYKQFSSKPKSVSPPNTSLNVTESSPSTVGTSATNVSLLSHGEMAILQTALVDVMGNNRGTKARILFDTGCSRSFITTELSNRIKARPRGREIVSIAGFSSTKRKTQMYDMVEIDVIQRDGRPKTLTVNVTDNISCPIQKFPLDVQANPVVRTMNLAEPLISSPQQMNIDILLGIDYYYEFVTCGRLEFPNGLILLPSSLGFIATGRVSCDSGRNSAVSSLKLEVCQDPSLLHIERYWSLEDIGVKSPSSTNDDEEAMATFNKTVQFKDNRYHVTLPFKSDARELPENYKLAQIRLNSLFKRVGGQEAQLQKYDDIIQDQLSKGVVEPAPIVPTGDKVHYIPHHCVVTPDKANTKLRIVYDASAKASKDSPSLNECLHRGPVILDDLCGLLVRFRVQPIGLVSDIEKAFLQVGLQSNCRDVARFLWVKDINKPPVGDNQIILRFCRVLFGAIASPFLLGAVIKHHLNISDSPVAADIDNCVYVDNVITGKRNPNDASDFYVGAKKLFGEASMNLREWFTNSNEVLENIRPEDRGKSSKTKVLGLSWDTEKDTLSCSSFVVQEESVNTKRLMLKYLAKVFDPCGYFSAVTVTGKLLIQKLWKAKYGWDDTLPLDILCEWQRCCSDLQKIADHPIPRCYDVEIGTDDTKYELHCFCDASGKAYAAVVYLRITSSKGISSNIVFAKTRVGPVKQLSIPRMELMAAVVGVRIMSFVEINLKLPISDRILWSDAQCVLHWIASQKVETTFVKNRIAEIRSHVGVNFRYVPTAVNPADLSSRGCSMETITGSRLWWHGPEWLVDYPSNWPADPIPIVEPGNSMEAVETPDHAMVNTDDDLEDRCPIKISRYSSLNKLLRVTAWVKRFANNCKGTRQTGNLSAQEIASAQLFWELHTQKQQFGNILSGSNDSKTKQVVKQLNLFVDNNGLIRCAGRLDEAGIPESAKNPILLPKNNYFSDLVITDCHIRLYHTGVSHTMSQLRYKYWIPHGRSQVKRVVKKCFICRMVHGGPFQYPDPPNLPSFRVNKLKPFSAVGIDYLGPLYVKTDIPTEQAKVWICLFTCAATRALHLEVVDNLTASHFVLGLRRFVATRGAPQIIVSDNAKHFQKTSVFFNKIWRDILKTEGVQAFSAKNGIKWSFITELSPWMGGFYERMVGIVKSSIKKTLGKRCVSVVELQTVVSEIASIVNSRPLVYTGADLSDVALTPSHFLGGPHNCLPDVQFEPDEYLPPNVTPNELVSLWRQRNIVLDQFWKLWRDHYLLGLRNNNFVFKQRNTCVQKPTVGTTVIIKDNMIRKHWRIGRIDTLPLGRDGKCRSAKVMLPNGKYLNRPLNLLYPIEIGLDSDNNTTASVKDDSTKCRPKRRAADVAKRRIAEDATQVEISDSDSSY